jgi:hypothetical protein
MCDYVLDQSFGEEDLSTIKGRDLGMVFLDHLSVCLYQPSCHPQRCNFHFFLGVKTCI